MVAISERGHNLLKRGPAPGSSSGNVLDLISLCNALLSVRGEASGTAVARKILNRYSVLDESDRASFFESIAENFGSNVDRVSEAVEAWRTTPNGTHAVDLHFASEPQRQELFRRLNRAPGATHQLVTMRANLLDLGKSCKNSTVVDRDLVHLLSSWFNPGFLILRRIDWSTPAAVLEKVIRYEAVHEIRGWSDLRSRIDPEDRRCYAFFHPALNDEPLIFVEVALTMAIPGAIAPLLDASRPDVAINRVRTAVFYSISNCQRGLAGISFGNFLIKQVVEELRRELPKLENFVTLSPAPGFLAWLRSTPDLPLTNEERALLAELNQPDWIGSSELSEQLRATIEPLAAHYFLKAKTPRGLPIDPVARFHLGNGARLEQIHWQGDLSSKGLRESAGVMVNYLYRLEDIEKNHEAFANHGEITASSAVEKLLKRKSRTLLDLRLR